MIRDLWLVGIGTGSPQHITLAGQDALRNASVILLPYKGAGKDDLAHLRQAILDQAGSTAHVIPFDMPVRDESLPYQTRVAAWHDAIADQWRAAIAGCEIDGPVALLVWGDPGLYDSTLRIADRLNPKPNIHVVPGVTALQALTAAHAIPFNTVDGPVMVTTGRQLREHGLPENATTTIVMLDGACSFQHLDPTGLHIWWGGFLGMPEQVLVSGPLAQVSAQIMDTRAKGRSDHGWIMDTYLIRKSEG